MFCNTKYCKKVFVVNWEMFWLLGFCNVICCELGGVRQSGFLVLLS